MAPENKSGINDSAELARIEEKISKTKPYVADTKGRGKTY